MSTLPDFDSLPKVEGMPQGCAWGIFDKDGEKDVYGTLNLLTPDVVKAAAAEVKDGISISLNWPLDGIKFPLPGRIPVEHKVHYMPEMNAFGFDAEGFDDELHFNTQLSSQWDSLCHMQHQDTKTAYNGAKPTKEALTSSAPNLPTVDRWHARGGVVGRGVLVDFQRWAEEKELKHPDGRPYSPVSGWRVTVQELEEVAKHQGVEFKHGDILIVRTGITKSFEFPTPQLFGDLTQHGMSGVHGVEETARWVWNKHFSAVAGDAQAFEAYPPLKPDGTPGSTKDLVLHQYFLSLFGLPIGELWDLAALSEHCKKTGRYSFLLTSAPLNHTGLVASPPNALAIF